MKILVPKGSVQCDVLVKSGLGISILAEAIQGNFDSNGLHFINVQDIREKFYVGAAWM